MDLRSQKAYEKGHIKGALHLGADITEERLQQLVPDKKATILTYCQNTLGPPSRMMSLTDICLPQIIVLGYPNTFVLKRPSWLPPESTDNQYYESVFGSLWEAGSDNDVNASTNTAKKFSLTSPQADAYLIDLQHRIKGAWFPPKDSGSRKVVVSFTVHQRGELSCLRLIHSSGIAGVDQAALKAVENAAPFRQLPPESPDEIHIQFTFDENFYFGSTKRNAIFQ